MAAVFSLPQQTKTAIKWQIYCSAFCYRRNRSIAAPQQWRGRTAAIAPATKGQMYFQRRFFGLLWQFWLAVIVPFFLFFFGSVLVTDTPQYSSAKGLGVASDIQTKNKKKISFLYWSKYQRPHLTPLQLNIEKYQLTCGYHQRILDYQIVLQWRLIRREKKIF